MQISTSQFFGSSLAGMLNQQNLLNSLSQQLSTGNTLVNPSNQPVAAEQNIQLTAQISQLANYTQNGQNAQNALQLESSTLQNVGTLINQVQQLAQQMNNGTVNGSDLQNAAATMQGYLQQMLQYGNAQDGQGNYLFAGSANATQPFLQQGDGSVVYVGDGGQNQLALGPGLQTATGDPGSAVFMSSLSGNGTFSVSAASGNYAIPPSGSANDVGTLSAGQGSVLNAAQANQQIVADGVSYEVTVSRTSSGMTYSVTSGYAGSAGLTSSGTVSSGTYTAGMSIGIPPTSGSAPFITLPLSGEPAPLNPAIGVTSTQESFTVSASKPQSVFQTMQDLIKAFQLGTGSPGDNAQRAQTISNGLANLAQAQTTLLNVQSNVGARIQQTQAVSSQNATITLQLQTQQASLTNINYPAVISQYEQSLTALQASESAFSQMQGLSLFKYL